MKSYLLAGLTLGLMAALAGAVALIPFPSKIKAPQRAENQTDPAMAENEEKALEFLRQIPDVQGQYEIFSGLTTAATLSDLRDFEDGSLLRKELHPRPGREDALHCGYHFQIFTDPRSHKFCAYAWPEKNGETGRHTFIINETETCLKTKEIFSGQNQKPQARSAFSGNEFSKKWASVGE